MKINCCKYCTEETGRHPGCHSKCEEYIEEKQRLDKFNERKRNENQAEKYRNNCIDNALAGYALQKTRHSPKRFFKKER